MRRKNYEFLLEDCAVLVVYLENPAKVWAVK